MTDRIFSGHRSDRRLPVSDRERVVFIRVVIAPVPEAEFVTDPECSCPVVRYVDGGGQQTIRNEDIIGELRDTLVNATHDNLWSVVRVTSPGVTP